MKVGLRRALRLAALLAIAALSAARPGLASPEGAAPAAPVLVVLSTGNQGDFHAVIDRARELGGDVTLAYPPDAFVAHLPPAAEQALRRHPAVGPIERGRADPAAARALGGQAETAARAWNRIFHGEPDGPAGLPGPRRTPRRPDADVKIPPDLNTRAAAGARGAAGAPAPDQTSEFLAGSVVASVIFVESSGGAGRCALADRQTENWDAARRSAALSEIGAGLAFWTARADRPSPLTFLVDDRGVQPTSCEPIARPHADEGLWIADALAAQGFPAEPRGYVGAARRFADSRRAALGADWAFSIFVVDSLDDPDGAFADETFAYAYLSGPFFVLTYDNGGWGIGRMHLVAAHETGHIFQALDEYAASGCSTGSTAGYLDVANASCNNGGITGDVSIMGEGAEMDSPAVDVSASARGAIGWRNPTPGAGPGAVVDVVRTSSVSLTPFAPDPTADGTPTYSAAARNSPFPPGGCNSSGCHVPITVARVGSAEARLDDGAWSDLGVSAADGAFDDEAEAYTFTPPSAVPVGTHTFGTRATNTFGHVSDAAADTLTIAAPDCCVLTVTKAGAGTGRVTSTPPGLDCGSDCSEAYRPGLQVTLQASAGDGSRFAGWGGACGGAHPTCGLAPVADASVTATFTRDNQPPAAKAGGSYRVPEGGTRELSGSGADPDGDAVAYAWDLDGDGSFETPGRNPTFSAVGADGPSSRTVVLRVCEDGTAGRCATDPAAVSITNADPTIDSVTDDGPIPAGSGATITVAASDPAGSGDPLRYEFDCDDDGAYEVGPQVGSAASCTFGSGGDHRVNVRVTDDDGGSAAASTTVEITSTATPCDRPSPGSSASKLKRPAAGSKRRNRTYRFAGDPGIAAPCTLAGQRWDFGNEQTATTSPVTHTFAAKGRYTVWYAVTDSRGQSGTAPPLTIRVKK